MASPVGHLLQLIGPHRLGMLGQCAFGLLHLHRTDMIRQVPEELLDDPHMLPIQQPGIPRLGRRRQQRRQLHAGQRRPRGQLLGIPNPTLGRRTTDPQDVGQHDRHRRTALVLLEMAGLVVGDGNLPADRRFQPRQGSKAVRCRQLLDIGCTQEFDRRLERIQRHSNRTHVRIL
jgi:hypothetical protein